MARSPAVVCTVLLLLGLVHLKDLMAVSRTTNDWAPRSISTSSGEEGSRGIDAVGGSGGHGRPPHSTDWAVKVKELEERLKELTRDVDRHLHNASSHPVGGHHGFGSPESAGPLLLLSLPWCDELMRRSDGVYADGNFLASHATRVRWAIRADGSRELQYPDLCRMRRYTAPEAQRCLSGVHVSMIGDSLTRYQYLSLAHLLENGEFPPRFASPKGWEKRGCMYVNETEHPVCSTPDRPNLCVEGEWGDWRRYQTALGGGDDGGIMNGRLECRSFRPTGGEKGESNDNLLYRAAESGAILSYMSEFGWGNSPTPLHGFYFTNCTMDGSCRRTEQDNVAIANRSLHSDFDFSQPFPEAIFANGTVRNVLPKPDVALYNRGIWGDLSAERAKAIFPAMYDWVGGGAGVDGGSDGSSPTKGRCYFKSTTANYHSLATEQGKNERHRVRPHAYRAGCSYLDYAHLTEEFGSLNSEDRRSTERRSVYWDSVHFQPWVYEELNQVLLNALCNNGIVEAEAE